MVLENDESEAGNAAELSSKPSDSVEKTPPTLKPENAAETSSKPSPFVEKTPRILKPNVKIVKKVKKSSAQNSAKTDAAEPSSKPAVLLDETPKTLKPKVKIVKRIVKKVKKPSSEENSANSNAAEPSSEPLPLPNETPETLKPKRKIVKKVIVVRKVKKSSEQSSVIKESNDTSQIQSEKDEKKILTGGKRESNAKEGEGEKKKKLKLVKGSKEKKVTNETEEKTSQRGQKAEEEDGGLIFLCNSKTKSDCFRYRIVGVPENRLQFVKAIKPGLTMFLFDFELKRMHGIYKASSAGGLRLEPTAFDGDYPAQVRFEVEKECLPLAESVFKNAIKENYNGRNNRFNTQLTVQQVKRLTELFQPAPPSYTPLTEINTVESSPEGKQVKKSSGPPPEGKRVTDQKQTDREKKQLLKPLSKPPPEDRRVMDQKQRPDREKKQLSNLPSKRTASPDPLFLSEKDYRNYGLRREQHSSAHAWASTAPDSDSYRNNHSHEKEQIPNEGTTLDPLFLTEKEYRAYGLGGRREQPISKTSTKTPASETTDSDLTYNPKNPYYHYSSGLTYDTKDPYYNYSYGGTTPYDPYLRTPKTTEAGSNSYSLSTGRETYLPSSNYMEKETSKHARAAAPDENERLYSSYASRVLSDYNQESQYSEGRPEYKSVSSRYSFAGSSSLYR